MAGATGSEDWNLVLVLEDDEAAPGNRDYADMRSKGGVEIARGFLWIGGRPRRSGENLPAPAASRMRGNPLAAVSQVRQRPVGHRRSLVAEGRGRRD